MRHLYQIFSFVLVTVWSCSLVGQITSVRYDLIFNPSESIYDVFMVVAEGQTNSKTDRIQFNSQISFVSDTGCDLEVVKNYMPLVGHQEVNISTPIEWVVNNKIVSPWEDPLHIYYSISPTVAPTAFYNELKKGDRIKLFTAKLKNSEKNNKELKFYENGVDKVIKGFDLSNAFSLGGADQLFSGVISSSGSSYINYR